jgi:hypothetical protein
MMADLTADSLAAATVCSWVCLSAVRTVLPSAVDLALNWADRLVQTVADPMGAKTVARQAARWVDLWVDSMAASMAMSSIGNWDVMSAVSKAGLLAENWAV